MKWKQRDNLASRIRQEALRLGYESASPHYLFEAYDEVPEGFKMPAHVDSMEPFCRECGEKLLRENGYDPDPSWDAREAYQEANHGYDPPRLIEDSSESDCHYSCPTCGKHLDSSYTEYCCEEEAAGFGEDGPILPYELQSLAHLVEQTDWQDGPLKTIVEDLATTCVSKRLVVTAAQERDARLRESWQALVGFAGRVAKSFSWLGRMAEQPYYEDD